MTLLKPDSSTQYLKYYHKSSKLLIPLMISSGLCHYKDFTFAPVMDTICVFNMGFHSYVSVSCVIHDYIKPTFWNQGARIMNAKVHALAIGGYIYAANLYKNYD